MVYAQRLVLGTYGTPHPKQLIEMLRGLLSWHLPPSGMCFDVNLVQMLPFLVSSSMTTTGLDGYPRPLLPDSLLFLRAAQRLAQGPHGITKELPNEEISARMPVACVRASMWGLLVR